MLIRSWSYFMWDILMLLVKLFVKSELIRKFGKFMRYILMLFFVFGYFENKNEK